MPLTGGAEQGGWGRARKGWIVDATLYEPIACVIVSQQPVGIIRNGRSTLELKLTKSGLSAMDRPWFLACPFKSTTHGGGLGWVDCYFSNELVMRRRF